MPCAFFPLKLPVAAVLSWPEAGNDEHMAEFAKWLFGPLARHRRRHKMSDDAAELSRSRRREVTVVYCPNALSDTN
jgi:hypothetical protein